MSEILTAIESFARKAAHEIFTEYLRGESHQPWMDRRVANVFINGNLAYEKLPLCAAVLHATLTHENISSEESLTSALLASRAMARSEAVILRRQVAEVMNSDSLNHPSPLALPDHCD